MAELAPDSVETLKKALGQALVGNPEHDFHLLMRSSDIKAAAEVLEAIHPGLSDHSQIALGHALLNAGYSDDPSFRRGVDQFVDRLLDGLSDRPRQVTCIVPLNAPLLPFEPVDIPSCGTAIKRFDTAQLAAVIQQARLDRWARTYPRAGYSFDVEWLSRWLWLRVDFTKKRQLNERLGLSFDFESLDHVPVFDTSFGSELEDPLATILIATAKLMPDKFGSDGDLPCWRPFAPSFVYRVEDDILRGPSRSPAINDLATDLAFDPEGNDFEVPLDWHDHLEIGVTKAQAADALQDCRLVNLNDEIIGTPARFLLEAWRSDRIIALMHICTGLEALLTSKTSRVTNTVCVRLSRLLEDPDVGGLWCQLYNFRGDFVHGRNASAVQGSFQWGHLRRGFKLLARAITVAGDRCFAERITHRSEFIQSLSR